MSTCTFSFIDLLIYLFTCDIPQYFGVILPLIFIFSVAKESNMVTGKIFFQRMVVLITLVLAAL